MEEEEEESDDEFCDRTAMSSTVDIASAQVGGTGGWRGTGL
jgi:hypothetical protein